MEPQGLPETLDSLRGLPREAATVEFKGSVQEPMEIGQ